MAAEPPPTSRAHTSDVIGAGIVAGLIAGVAMGLVAMIRSAILGLGFWLPMKLIAGLYVGVGTLLGGSVVILLGVATHLAVAMVWGIVFAALVRGRRRVLPDMIAGLVYGAVVWLIMTYGILIWSNPTMYARANVAMSAFFAYHLVFGALLGLTPAIARALHRRHAAAYRVTFPGRRGRLVT